MNIDLTPDEHAYLLRMLGGPSTQGTRTLGEGLSGEGVVAFRRKVEEAGVDHERAMAMLDVIGQNAEYVQTHWWPFPIEPQP